MPPARKVVPCSLFTELLRVRVTSCCGVGYAINLTCALSPEVSLVNLPEGSRLPGCSWLVAQVRRRHADCAAHLHVIEAQGQEGSAAQYSRHELIAACVGLTLSTRYTDYSRCCQADIGAQIA